MTACAIAAVDAREAAFFPEWALSHKSIEILD